MERNESCRFCGIVSGQYNYTEIDQPFLTAASYIAVASIGALVEGWTLILPLKHQLSLQQVYEDADFQDFTCRTISLLKQQYGPIIAFEHGANQEGSITSCGTNHAHLHLVPFKASLAPKLQSTGLQWMQCRLSDVLEAVGDNEYLFYMDMESNSHITDQTGYLHILSSPTSQFFRKILAEHLGCPETSNYREFPHLDASTRTSQRLAALSNHNLLLEEM